MLFYAYSPAYKLDYLAGTSSTDYTLTTIEGSTGATSSSNASLTLSSGYKTYFYIGVVIYSSGTQSVNWSTVAKADQVRLINSLKGEFTYFGINLGHSSQETGTSKMGASGSQEVIGVGTNVIVGNGEVYKSNVDSSKSTSISFNAVTGNSTAVIEYGGVNDSTTTFTASLPRGCNQLVSSGGSTYTSAIYICENIPSGEYNVSLGANSNSAMAIVAYVFPTYSVKLDDIPSNGTIVTDGSTNANGSRVMVIGTGAINASAPGGYRFDNWSLSNSINASVSNLTGQNAYLSVYGNVTLLATYLSSPASTSTSTTTSTSTSTTSISSSSTSTTSSTSSTTTSTTSTSTSLTSTSSTSVTTSVTTTSVSTTSTPTTVGVLGFPVPTTTSTTSSSSTTTVSTSSTSSSVTTTVPFIPANTTFAEVSVYPYAKHPSYVFFNNSKLVLEIESNSNSPSAFEIGIRNITGKIRPPAQHFEVSVLNITYSNASVVTNVLATVGYPCYIKSAVSPFYYSEGAWVGIANYSVNRQLCLISFALPNDIVVGLMARNTVTNITTTSTILYVPTHYSVLPIWYFALLAAVIIVVAVLITAYAFRRAHRKEKAVSRSTRNKVKR